MNIAQSASFLIVGALSGFFFVLSCGDNWSEAPPHDGAVDTPDAATVCECPKVELPFAARLIVVSNTRLIEPNSKYLGGIACPTGAHILTGSCSTDDDINALDVTLKESRVDHSPTLDGWSCNMHNNEPSPVNFRTSGLCLKATP